MPSEAGKSHAAGILLTHGDRALFLKRSDASKDHAGEWCCPGGSIEGGETPEQAAHREMQEETLYSAGDLTQIDEGLGFVTFRGNVDAEFDPTLNDEHTEFKWAPLTDPPQPLHPGVTATLKKMLGGAALDRRDYDSNNWFVVFDNPLSKVGVYPYSEASITKGGDRNKMVGVFRPAEELGSQECIDSFKLMPWTDDHPATLFGDKSQGYASTEDKGVRGVIGEKVYFKDDTLYGNLKVFSEELARKIAGGKKELSCGYHCDFVKADGVYAGVPYSYVQKNMRGNHVASVSAGRMGSDVRVLDAAERFTFALDMKDDSTEFATEVAGVSDAEKVTTNGHQSNIGVNPMAVAIDAKGDVKDPVKKDDSPSDIGKDAMSEEQEEGMDAAECAKDADEEKADEKDESKEAKDRGRARDRRAGARDARKSARDRKAARDAKSAKDAEKDDDKKDKGMDAAEITVLVRKEIAAGSQALDAADIVKQVIAQVQPAIRKEEAAKAALYGRVSPIIGAFDASEMTHVEMATYSLGKLGAPKAADPVNALDFYLAGRSQVAVVERRFAQDAVSDDSYMGKYLNS